MPEYTPQPIRIPGCLPRELAQAIEPVRQLFERAIFGDTIDITVDNSTHVSNETINQIHDAGNLTGSLPAAVFASGNIYVEGTLGSALASGGTQTVDGRTISGKAIIATFQAPNGAAFGAIWNGTNYTLIWCNPCPEQA